MFLECGPVVIADGAAVEKDGNGAAEVREQRFVLERASCEERLRAVIIGVQGAAVVAVSVLRDSPAEAVALQVVEGLQEAGSRSCIYR
jgi:hypothetical protein